MRTLRTLALPAAASLLTALALGCEARQPAPGATPPVIVAGEAPQQPEADFDAGQIPIPDQAEADAQAAEEISAEDADELFEQLQREILEEWEEFEEVP